MEDVIRPPGGLLFQARLKSQFNKGLLAQLASECRHSVAEPLKHTVAEGDRSRVGQEQTARVS